MIRSEYAANLYLAPRAARPANVRQHRSARHSRMYQSATMAHYSIALLCLSLVMMVQA
jgi:hypothetical protein